MNYTNLSMYPHIKDAVASVLEAENNSLAWKQEAKERMKDVAALVTATKKVDKLEALDMKELVSFIKKELTEEEEAPEQTEIETPDTPTE